MKLNITRDPVQDTVTLPFPWNPEEVQVVIRRWGHPAFQRKIQARTKAAGMAALRKELQRRGVKMKDGAKLQGEGIQEYLDEMELADMLESLETPGAEELYHLVEEMPGLEADGKPCKWTEEIAIDLFGQVPEFGNWVSEHAQELEEQFQLALEACKGNSPATSGASPEVATTS